MTRRQPILSLFAVALFTICATAQVSVAPTGVNCGNQVIGTTSVSKNVTLTNGTASALTMNSVATGDADFIILVAIRLAEDVR